METEQLTSAARLACLAEIDATGLSPAVLASGRRFVSMLPLGYPMPSVGTEPDGDLSLEWYRDTSWLLSVSVSLSCLYYAGLFGSDDPRGILAFHDRIPDAILSLIRRTTETANV